MASRGMHKLYSRQDIVRAIRRLSDDGEMPKPKQAEVAPYVQSLDVIYDRFNSWREVAEAAGLEYEHGWKEGATKSPYSRKDLIDALQQASGGDERLKSHEFNANPNTPSTATIIRRFGSFHDGLLEAGLISLERYEKIRLNQE